MTSIQEYRLRRQNLAKRLKPNAIAIIPSAQELLRNGDAHFRFRQGSDFYYLTGFNEPDAVLVIFSGEEGRSLLFNRTRNPSEEQWTGKRLGQESAGTVLGVDEAKPIDEFNGQLTALLSGKSIVYYALGKYPELEARIMQSMNEVKLQVRKGVIAPDQLRDVSPILGEMRLFKSEAEITLMRRAASISVDAHKRAMKACKNAQYEYQLESELLYEFKRQGCNGVAYVPIVGGGENTCILHYNDNNKKLNAGDLVLIDAGGEFGNYAADITRVFPVNGRFSEEQRCIYELVLKAQKAGIACIKPGVLWNEIQQTIIHILTDGLCELGLLSGKVDKLVETQAYKPFYMHNSGHWLGLDVHDCGAYKVENEWRPLEPGMVLTAEPGLYISAGMPGVEERWWNIGVRIEDDILVTPTGHDDLTAALPVEVEDIEALMRE